MKGEVGLDGRPRGWRVRRGELQRGAPVGLLVLALGVAGFGALEAHRAQASHEATVEGVLHDYGVFAARSYVQNWNAVMRGSLQATLDDAYGAALRHTTTQQCLNTLLLREDAGSADRCGCGSEPLVGADAWAFHVTLGSDGAFGRLVAGAVPPAPERDRILDELTSFARDHGLRQALRWIDGPRGPEPYVFASIRSLQDDTVVYGVRADPAKVAATMERALDHEYLLPRALTDGVSNRELLAVQVSLADGRSVWTSEPGVPLRLAGEQEIPGWRGGGMALATILPEAADRLIIGGQPKNRTPLLLLVFALSTGLALLAVNQLRDEHRLARLRSDFVASVSHELRTPLAQVRLFAETLRLGRAHTQEQRDWALENIDRETLRLTGLVENVLAFSRAERGRLEHLDLEPGDVGQHVEGAVRSFQPLVRPGQATFEMSVQPGVAASLNADGFRQVLLNLLDNAVKYGPRGQTVRVRVARDEDEVLVSVEDEGPGIPDALGEAIWQPFKRGDDAVGSVVAGSGIGLAVVRDIVHAHGGRVRVEHGERGARFVVALPLVRTPLEAAAEPAVTESADAPASDAAGAA